MDFDDAEKLLRDPGNEQPPFIVFDKSQRCHLWANHQTCDGTIMIGKLFHVYCDCDCHKKEDA